MRSSIKISFEIKIVSLLQIQAPPILYLCRFLHWPGVRIYNICKIRIESPVLKVKAFISLSMRWQDWWVRNRIHCFEIL